MTTSERALDFPQRRSDRVRARRARRVREVERVARPQPAERRKVRRPRRRYDLTLSPDTGVAMQLPAVPALSIGPRLLSAVLFAGALLIMRALLSSPTYRVGAPAIEGASLLSPSQVRSIAGLDGLSVFAVDPVQARERLTGLPEIAEAKVRVGWPNRLSIELMERPPVVSWNDGGRVWWLSEDGLAYIAHGSRADLVQIVSPTPSLQIGEDPLAPVVDPELLRAANELGKAFPEAAPIVYDAAHGLGFIDPRGWTAYFGADGDIAVKADIYRALAARLLEQGKRVTLVSVEDSAAPYYIVE